MSITRKELYPGDTVSRYYYFKDKAGAAFDPVTTDVEIYDPDGTEISSPPSLSKIETGKYEFNYNLAEDAPTGTWLVFIKGEKGTFANTEKFAFKVIKKIL